jgi:hypothetical protein
MPIKFKKLAVQTVPSSGDPAQQLAAACIDAVAIQHQIKLLMSSL